MGSYRGGLWKLAFICKQIVSETTRFCCFFLPPVVCGVSGRYFAGFREVWAQFD